MQIYTYQALGDIKSTVAQPIVNANGEQTQFVQRVYDNRIKKLLDGYFDNRYFLKYQVLANEGQILYEAKKIFRRGKVWFEVKDYTTDERFIINYENWRIGVPELFVSGTNFKMKIDKEMDDWSNFLVEDEIVARWLAVYDEAQDQFSLTLELYENAPIQKVGFYIAIAQAALFIGV